ncbi:MAG: hypothetical protein GQ527_01400 [Bacteroidales bacterium]|nr:hypothetical protein [Bacteroidales bacterium]
MRFSKLIIAFLLLTISFQLHAQKSFVRQNSLVDSLVVLHKKINSMDSLVTGYRIQIFFESGNYSKDLALQTAEEFNELYPEIRYYLSFNEPYYRIRVGDFRTIIEAKGFLMKILSKYPSAFEVRDMIYFPPLPD